MHLYNDFYPIWAAAQITLAGGNPYDDAALDQAIFALAVPGLERPAGFHYPPWSLWLFLPFGLLPFPAAAVLWGILSLTCTAVSVRIVLRFIEERFGRSWNGSIVALLITVIAFFPFTKNILWGQTSHIMLLGTCAMIALAERNQWSASGLALSLALIKPHILAIPALYYLIRAFRESSRSAALFVTGTAAGLLFQSAFSGVFTSPLVSNFLAHLTAFVRSRETASQSTLGHLLSANGGPGSAPLVAFALGAVFTAVYSFRIRPDAGRDLPLLLTLAVTVPIYAWANDQMLVLTVYLAVCAVLIDQIRTRALIFISAHAAVLWAIVAHYGVPGEMTLVVYPLVLYALFRISQSAPSASGNHT